MHFVPSLKAYTAPHPKALYWILGWEGRFLGFMHAHVCVCVHTQDLSLVGRRPGSHPDSPLISWAQLPRLQNQDHLSLPHLFQGLSS